MLKPDWKDLSLRLGPRLKNNEKLAPYTTLRIGGPADWLVRVDSVDELIEYSTVARLTGMPVFILGNGSNILVSDQGIRGLVVENHADNYSTQEIGGRLLLSAESGALLPTLANRLARQGWSGLEWAIGVPSTVGAAVVGNAGAHGGSISDILVRTQVLNADGAVDWLENADLGFSYRTSRLKLDAGRWIVLCAEFWLIRDDPDACIARMNRYTEHRRRTQPTDPSVGSMFKNPPGDYAGRLLDAAGLKGTRIGSIQVSTVHANFFVNSGGGTAQDVVQLLEFARETVKAKFGVDLELEIQLVGDWDLQSDGLARASV